MIELRDVSKTYDNNVEAVKNINLTIEDGEFVFLVGESGSGKSTLLSLLMREFKPTSGDIWVNGRNIAKLRRGRVADYRRTLGVVFQDYKLFEGKTVYENVSFAMEVIEESEKRIRHKVPRALKSMNLYEKASSYPGQLSGGEKQRCAIARAIVNDPLILLADEPTGNLDPKNSEDVIKRLENINRFDTTVIVATHDRDMVNRHRHRVIELRHGELVRDCAEGGYEDDAE